MSFQQKYEEEIREVCEQYYDLLQQKDAIEDQLDELHDYMEITMRKYSRDEYDDPEVPVRVVEIVIMLMVTQQSETYLGRVDFLHL